MSQAHLRTLWHQRDGSIEYEEFKAVAKWAKDGINDDELLEMQNTTQVSQKTSYNDVITLEEFGRCVEFRQ